MRHLLAFPFHGVHSGRGGNRGRGDPQARGCTSASLVGELERMHSHLLWLGVAGHELGFDTLFMYTWRDRELVLDLLAMLTGNRVNYGINTFGGVRRDITPEQMDEIRKAVDTLEERTKYYIELAAERDDAHHAHVRRGQAFPRGRAEAGRGRPCGPRRRRGPGRAPRRPLCRLWRDALQCHHRQPC